MPRSIDRLAARLGRGNPAPARAIGVEAGEGWLRVVEPPSPRTGNGWRTFALETDSSSIVAPADRAAADSSSNLRDRLDAVGIGTGEAVGALTTPSLHIFPLTLPTDSRKTLDTAVINQARDRLGYPIEEAVLDYVILPRSARRADAVGCNVLVYALPASVVGDLLDRFEPAGIEIVRVLTPALALAPGFATTGDAERDLLIASAPTATAIAVIEGGQVIMERVLGWGYDRLVEAATTALSLPAGRARRLLSGEARVEEPETLDHVLREILTSTVHDLVHEATGCLGYCTSFLQHRPVRRVTITGPLGQLDGVSDSIARQLNMARCPSPGVDAPGAPCPAGYATAAGCALLGDREAA